MMLKRCISFLTMTTTPKKLETYYPMHCFPPKYTHIPPEGQTFLNFLQHLRRQSGKKQVLSGKKQKAVIHMQLAQLNLLLKPLPLQLSLTPAQQGQWNMTSILLPSTAVFRLTHQLEIGDSYSSWAAALMQSAQNQPCTLFKPPFVRQSQWRQSGLLPPLLDPPPKKHQHSKHYICLFTHILSLQWQTSRTKQKIGIWKVKMKDVKGGNLFVSCAAQVSAVSSPLNTN